MVWTPWQEVAGLNFREIIYEKRHRRQGGGVARITFNRPERMNSLTHEGFEAIAVAQVVKDYPEAFIGAFACVDPWKGEMAIQEIEQLILEGYRTFYETGGPRSCGSSRWSLTATSGAGASDDRLLREERAELHCEGVRQLYPMVRACEQLAPNGIVRRRVRQTEERYRKNFGPPSPSQEVMSYYILAKAFQAQVHEAIDPRNHHPRQEPFKKYIYYKQGNGSDSPPYRVVYPIPDRRYEVCNTLRNAKEQIFKSALGLLDRALGREEARTTAAVRVKLM